MNNESEDCSRRESFDMPVFPDHQNEIFQQICHGFSNSAE